MANTHAVTGSGGQASTQTLAKRSRVTATDVIPANSAISVNAAQIGTSHKGATDHNLGTGDAQLQTNLGVTVFITVNGVVEDIEHESASQVRFPNLEIDPASKIDIETQ